MNKAFALTVFRSLIFGLCAFVLISLSKIKVYSSWDVAGFVLGAAFLWYLIEIVVLKAVLQKKNKAKKN